MRLNELEQLYKDLKSKNFNIDLSRGKPSPEQLDLSNSILTNISQTNLINQNGLDYRNYSNLDGVEGCNNFFANIFGLDSENILTLGNSSLFLEYELIADAYIKGICGSEPWCKLPEIKFICLVPGYDRHFKICEHFGIKMINVPLKENGPDMDAISELIKDPLVKGIWCTPIYSNPLGITFSDDVVRRFARLSPAAKDFRIFWDMAYALHHLTDKPVKLLNIFEEARKCGNEDYIYAFASTSKITFAGSGIAAIGCSLNNKKSIVDNFKTKLICADKINQARHAMFLESESFVQKHMEKHKEILLPKFNGIINGLKSVSNICKIVKPEGGYFISIFVKKGTAKNVIKRCFECGLKLTEAGCGYPYHVDLDDSHIRLAPTFLNLNDVEIASLILCTCIELEYLLNEGNSHGNV